MLMCPNCGQENPDGFRFCGRCAGSLEPEAHERREERKVITVLFADLVGFTARAERMDPEDVRALLAPYHQRLRYELERFGGTVEKFIGDAVMALFGAPVAHEDDPERALRAALAIRDWVIGQGEALQARIAVNTGEALVSPTVRPERGEGMASGDVINTAARLQAAAPVNGILVGETTYRATRHAIEYRKRPPVEAKGKAEPVGVWEAVQAHARLGVDVVQEAHATLVGRERELALLRQSLARLLEERAPQLVTLVGVPGIGKSRLVYELLQLVEEGRELITWRQGRSLPYGEGVAFWALGEMAKAQAGVLESDSADNASRKLAAAVAEAIRDEKEAAWVAAHVRPLVGVGEDMELGGDRRSEAFAAWRRFFEALAEQRPLVLVFEDLHFADEGLLDFVDHLVDWASGVPILVLATARPELLDHRPGWGGGKPNATTLSLSPLSDKDTASLIGALLNRAVLEAEIQSDLLARAGGNPLYAEQYVRMLLELGEQEELPLPESIQGIIASRLDALAPEEKSLLQAAAVIGKVFWLGALAALDGGLSRAGLEERLHGLERRQFVRREHRSAVADEPQYAFLHLLVRDVVYGQIPRGLRAEKHRLAAGWIESLGRPQDHAEMLAHHYGSALGLVRAVGGDEAELQGPARAALCDAGDRAFSLHAYLPAARFYEAALELWPADSFERAELLFRAGRARSIGVEGGGEQLAQARDGLLAHGDRGAAAEAEMLLCDLIWRQGRRDLAHEHLRGARSLIEGAEPSWSTAFVLSEIARFLMLAGQREDGTRLGREGLAMAEALGLDALRADALCWIGTARVVNSGDRSGIEDLQRSIEIGEQANAPLQLCRSYNNLGAVLEFLGEVEPAYTARLEGERIAERLGAATWVRWFQGVLPNVRSRRGDWDESLRMADDFIAAVDAGSPHYLEAQVYSTRAKMRLARGDSAGAIRDAQSALPAARAAKDPQMLYTALAVCTHVFSVTDRDNEATALAHEYLEALRGGLAPQWGITYLPTFASAALRLGRTRELVDALANHLELPWTEAARAYASGDFVRAAEIYAGIGSKPDEADARVRAAEALLEQGNPADADAQLRRALAFWSSVGATRYVGECEALLAPASRGTSLKR
jgi:class 3 adenylate cyclase/tetratricopeptide (TPR) repeat protein